MTHGQYLVTGSRNYRGHEPGITFEALLDRAAEQRAVHRGDIRLLRRITPTLPDGVTYPDGWLPPPERSAPPPNEGRESGPQS